MCDEKWILCYTQECPAQWSDLEAPPKHFPKPNLQQKKSWSLYGGCYPSDPLQLSESWWNHYIWEVCSTNQWDVSKTAMPAVDTHQPKGPIASPCQYVTQCHTTNTSKVEQIGLQSCASSTIFTWPLANWQPLVHHLDTFLQGKCFHNQQEAENTF